MSEVFALSPIPSQYSSTLSLPLQERYGHAYNSRRGILFSPITV